jgi:hypothetical protein
MIVYNAGSTPIVVRGFAEMVLADEASVKIIFPQEKEIVQGPPLPQYGFKTPYLLFGELIVRDAQGMNLPVAIEALVMSLEAGKLGRFYRPFYCDKKYHEGFFVAFYNESGLVGL